MWVEPPSVLVEEHQNRLRHDAQAPTAHWLTRLWTLLRRRQGPAPVVSLPRREIERLAA
jgi:hypothetical protein